MRKALDWGPGKRVSRGTFHFQSGEGTGEGWSILEYRKFSRRDSERNKMKLSGGRGEGARNTGCFKCSRLQGHVLRKQLRIEIPSPLDSMCGEDAVLRLPGEATSIAAAAGVSSDCSRSDCDTDWSTTTDAHWPRDADGGLEMAWSLGFAGDDSLESPGSEATATENELDVEEGRRHDFDALAFLDDCSAHNELALLICEGHSKICTSDHDREWLAPERSPPISSSLCEGRPVFAPPAIID